MRLTFLLTIGKAQIKPPQLLKNLPRREFFLRNCAKVPAKLKKFLTRKECAALLETYQDGGLSELENLRRKNWTVDNKDGKALPTKNLSIIDSTPIKKAVVPLVFQDINQYMKDGILYC